MFSTHDRGLTSMCTSLFRRAWQHQLRSGNLRERAIMAALALGMIIASLLTTSSAYGVVQLRCAVDPVMVDVSASSVDLLAMTPEARQSLIARSSQALQLAAAQSANAVVALRAHGF